MKHPWFALALIATLTACGGGGGNQASSDPANTPAAVLQMQSVPSAAASSTASAVAAKAVDLTDAIAILKMIVGLDVNAGGAPLTPYQAYAADVDGNGKVELSDAISVLKRIVGLETASADWMFFNGTPTVTDKLNPGLPPTLSAAVSSNTSMTAVLRGDVVSSSAYTYSWALTTVPAGSTAKETLANANAANPSFKADVAGSYVATMSITDGSNNVASTSVTLTACSASSNSSSPFTSCPTDSAGNTGNGSAPSPLSGIVSMGAPVLGASVTVFDAKGATVGSTTTDATTGAYSINVSSQYTGPFTVKATGDVGDATVTLYSTSATTGVVQVNPITHAIASSLDSSGKASALETGTTKSAADVATAQSAYAALLADPLSKLSMTGSLISSTYSDAYDKLLDNLSVKVNPSGETLIATTAGTQSNDLGESASAMNAFSYVKVPAGSLPQAANASAITGLTQPLGVKDLEPLVKKLQACFDNDHTKRGTNAAPAEACKHMDSADGGEVFLHNGNYWIDTTTTAGSNCQSKNPYCQGMFGWMIGYGQYAGQSDNRYDRITFNTPKILRSLNANTWVVRFPITYSNGMVGGFGDAVGNTTMVVKKYPSLVTATDPGWRFLGDQRKVSSYVSAVAQKIYNVKTGKVRYETGLNFYINGYQLRSFGGGNSPAKFVQKAVITGLGLPTNGITLYNKGSLPNDYGWNNACGGFVPIALTSQATSVVNPSYNPTGVALAGSSVACAGVLRLSYVGNNPVTSVSTSYMAGWDPSYAGVTDATQLASANLSDASINNIKFGELYTFNITISDGTTLVYKNRLENSVLDVVAIQKLEFPEFTDASFNALKTFKGQSDFSASWIKTKNSRVYNAAIYWSRGTYSNTQNLSGVESSMSTKSLTCGVGALYDAQAPDCSSATNWTYSGVESSAGIIQLRSRTADGFEIFSQIRQF